MRFVALAIPLTVAFTFGGMQLMGIPLQQISITGLIIALGVTHVVLPVTYLLLCEKLKWIT